MAEQQDLVLFEDCGSYAVVTFNRPEKLNALSSPMVQRFQEVLAECRGRHSVIVVTGVGEVFCAGVDLKERNAWVRSGAYIAEGDTDYPVLSDFEERFVGEWGSFDEYATELAEEDQADYNDAAIRVGATFYRDRGDSEPPRRSASPPTSKASRAPCWASARTAADKTAKAEAFGPNSTTSTSKRICWSKCSTA
mgnify:CR=1 FL=1